MYYISETIYEDHLNFIETICDSWESNMIYDSKFLIIIRNLVKNRIIMLKEKDVNIKDKIYPEYNITLQQAISTHISKLLIINLIEDFNIKLIS